MHIDHARDRAMEEMRQNFSPPARDDCNFDITEKSSGLISCRIDLHDAYKHATFGPTSPPFFGRFFSISWRSALSKTPVMQRHPAVPSPSPTWRSANQGSSSTPLVVVSTSSSFLFPEYRPTRVLLGTRAAPAIPAATLPVLTHSQPTRYFATVLLVPSSAFSNNPNQPGTFGNVSDLASLFLLAGGCARVPAWLRKTCSRSAH